MLTSLVSLQQENVKKFKKSVKILNIERKKLYILNDLKNCNKIFGRDVAYDNIESHEKVRFHSLYRKHIFGKTTGRVKLTSTPSLFKVKYIKFLGEICIQDF